METIQGVGLPPPPPPQLNPYLIFVISFTLAGFSKNKFYTQKKTTKGTKNTKNVSEKVKYMHFFHSIWKNLHLTENFYTDTVCGICDNYEVWKIHLLPSYM